MAAVMMLSHLGQDAAAQRLDAALKTALRDDNIRTRDLGGKANTKTFTDGVISFLGR